MNRTFPDYFHRLSISRWYTANSKLRMSGLQIMLWVIGVLALVYAISGYSLAAWHQARQKASFHVMASTPSSGPRAMPGDSEAWTKSAPGDLIGVIEIPRLGISSVVDEGIDNKTLMIAVGHVPGTAFPGQRGNVALAAHRDTFFKELGQLKIGDDIVLTTLRGAYHYSVESTRIVKPSANEVLAPSDHPTLTLITCYPFHYIGTAPRRFIVVAQQTPGS